MLEGSDPIAVGVTVITSRGHTVEADDDIENWRVEGGDWLTVGDLLALVICFGLNPGTGRLQ
ncbi:hypothetical protein [Methylobacterium sp. CM6246]